MRIPINELMMQLREKDIFNIEDVFYAGIDAAGILYVSAKRNDK
ncbi:MAG: DUF421 domain-containing protein [Clostridium sp.]|nr:DUF421 domain-containing protein [Clostridium sp.]